MMQTTVELQAALEKLQAELKTVSAIAHDRAARGYKVQALTSAVVLGTASKSDLLEANAELAESVEAMVTVQALERAIAEQRNAIEYARSRERAAECEDIRKAFDAALERHREASKECLSHFREMQRLDRQWAAMTASHRSLAPMLADFYRELNLPALTGSLSERSNIPTGAE